MIRFFAIGILLLQTVPAFAQDRQPPLTTQPGRSDAGEQIFNDRDKGHCLLCHQLSSNPEPFQGNIGPPLDSIGARLDAAQLRYRIVNIRRVNEDSIMPAYHKTKGHVRVAHAFKGKPILSAQEVEDVVAYLEAER